MRSLARRPRSPRRRARRARAPPPPPRPRRRRFGSPSRRRSPAAGRAGLLGVALVRLDDALHELVPHDVLVSELDESDPVDAREDLAHLDEPGRLLSWEV